MFRHESARHFTGRMEIWIKTPQGTRILRILAAIFVIGLTGFLLLNGHKIRQLGVYGYPGVFLLSILGSATIIIPLPTLAVTSAFGAVLDPFWVGIAAGLGSAIGELTGYLAGYSGQGVIERTKWHDRVEQWMKKWYGGLAIFFLAFIPLSLIDIAGMMAGALKVPWYKFLGWCVLGKILKMWVVAYGGAGFFAWLPFINPK